MIEVSWNTNAGTNAEVVFAGTTSESDPYANSRIYDAILL